MKTYTKQRFTCHYCSKVLCSRQRVDSHIKRYHRDIDTDDAPPNKLQRLGDDISERNEGDCESMDTENHAREALLKHIDQLQYGSGYNAHDGENDTGNESSDRRETESEVSDGGNTDDVDDEEDDEADDEDDDEVEDDEDDEEDDDEEDDDEEEEDIFDKVLEVATHNLTDCEGGYTQKELRKEFRDSSYKKN